MICPNCRTQNPAAAKFCIECATPLAAACPSCGTENPPGAKFCAECATPLGTVASSTAATPPVGGPRPASGAAAPVAERRLVSVLFADLVGFTPFAEEKDPEEVRETLSRYFEVARDVVERYGGTVEKFIGDAVMALWGAPTAREDDAERAVRAGLELVDAVPTLGPTIQARCGVLTGEAAVTLGATNEGMVAGDLVNTAARLQAIAAPGTVLVGEPTMRASSAAIAFEPVGEQALKGKAAPVEAWRALRVVAERRGRNRSDGLEAPFVGRDDELRLLKDLFHATEREGRARLVSVIGAAGIGKSRLAWEFLKYVDGLVETLYWHDGRSPAYGDGVTFYALGEMVRGRAGLLSTDDEATTRAKVAAVVAEHVEDEVERRWVESALLALLGFGSEVVTEQLFAAWRTFFERLAATGPVVLVFEDLHFADPGLLDFIDQLLDWSRGAPIVVLTLARPDLLDRRPNWGLGKRNFVSMALEPLPEPEMRALLSGLVPGLPEGAVEAIVRRADGVPLYAVETVRMLVADGRLRASGGRYEPVGDLTSLAVPETLVALIGSRLDNLAPETRSLVQDAAVLGQSFTLEALGAVTGLEATATAPALDDLVRREILRREVDPRSPDRGQLAFVQALIREVAYNTLSHRDRRTRHLAAARYFEGLGSEELAGALAGHYLAAHANTAEGPEADALAGQARIALRAAAERAASLGSHDQALSFAEQALSVTRDPAEEAELLALASRSARHAARLDRTEALLRRRLETLRATGDRRRILDAIAELSIMLSDRSHPDQALQLAEAARPEFADLEETAEGARLILAIARAYSTLDRPEDTLAWVERSLEVGGRLDLVEVIATGMMVRGLTIVRMRRGREALATIQAASELALAHDLFDLEMGTRTTLTFYAQWHEPYRGLEMARAGQVIARRQGSRIYDLLMVGNGALCATRVGEWDWAVALLDEWLQSDLQPSYHVELLADRATLAALRGEDASSFLREMGPLLDGVTDPQFASYGRMAEAWTALAAARLTDAVTAARAAVTGTTFFGPLGLPLAARAALWSADAAAARDAVDTLEGAVYYGAAVATDRTVIRAGLAALEGRTDEALAGYREALGSWRSLGLAWDEALTAIDMAVLLDPTHPEVAAAATSAGAILEQLGAAPFLTRLDELVAAAGGRRTPTGATPPSESPGAAAVLPDRASG